MVGIAAATLLSYIAMSTLWILITFLKFLRFRSLQAQSPNQIDGDNRVVSLPFKNTDVDFPLALQNLHYFIKYKANISRLRQFLFTRVVICIRNAKEANGQNKTQKVLAPQMMSYLWI